MQATPPSLISYGVQSGTVVTAFYSGGQAERSNWLLWLCRGDDAAPGARPVEKRASTAGHLCALPASGQGELTVVTLCLW